ncbi:MAG: hypothetical protein OEV44_00170 [Spirochaetota bacterium]|nr:hypothetical protein [Spirochaetota bacterium]
MKHTWINFPTASKKKCTRCGVIVEINRNGNYGKKYYLYEKVYDKSPPCKDLNFEGL